MVQGEIRFAARCVSGLVFEGLFTDNPVATVHVDFASDLADSVVVSAVFVAVLQPRNEADRRRADFDNPEATVHVVSVSGFADSVVDSAEFVAGKRTARTHFVDTSNKHLNTSVGKHIVGRQQVFNGRLRCRQRTCKGSPPQRDSWLHLRLHC